MPSLFPRLLLLFILAHFSHHLVTALLTPLLPFIREDFTLDYTQSGLLLSAFSLSYGISQLPAGWLADRIGRRQLLTIGILGVALAGLLVGFSQTYIMLIVFLGLMGMLGGGYHPSSVALISASFEEKKLGRVLGFHAIGGTTSFFLAPLIAIAITTAWGWRGSFITLAIPTFVLGIILYVLLRRVADIKKAEPEMPASDTETPPTPHRWRRLVPFIILSTFTGAPLFSTISFIPLFMVDQFGVSKELAGIFLILIYSSGFWAAPLGGYLSDRLGRIPVMLAVSFIAGPVIYLLNLAPYGVAFGAVLVAIGMISYIRMPVAEAYIIGQTSEKNRSTILGIYYFVGMEGSAILTPVVGYLIDHYGFYPTFTIIGATIVTVTLVCSIWLWRIRD